MNKLIKFALAVAVVALPFAASAATISNPVFSNGDTTISGTGGSTVSGTFTLTVGSTEAVEFVRTQSDPSQPFVDTSVMGDKGYQEGTYTNVPFTVKLPPNTGTYYPNVQTAGIWGGIRSISGGDSVNAGPVNLGTIRVVASGSTSSTPSGIPDSVWEKFLAWMNGSTGSTTPPPAVNPKCAALAIKLAGAMPGTKTNGNAVLQGYLIGEGASIPALAAGAAYGFYGNQTANAVAWFKSVNSCN